MMKRQRGLDPAAEGRMARVLFTHSLMSDTKWRKLIAIVRDVGEGVTQMTVKFIDVEEPRQMLFPPDLRCPRPYMDTLEMGPVALRSIEWMELSGDLTGLLGHVGQFMLEVHNERTRIIGYRRT